MTEDDWACLAVKAATVDELLSPAFVAVPGEREDTLAAGAKLAAWCNVSANGDWALFARRLQRDGLAFPYVLQKLSRVQGGASALAVPWLADGRWIEAALSRPASNTFTERVIRQSEPLAFEHLLASVVEEAEALLLKNLGETVQSGLSQGAWADLSRDLLVRLSRVCGRAFYEAFEQVRLATAKTANESAGGDLIYRRFVEEMRDGGARRLLAQKPVLLRLMASITRQWLDAEAEFLLRWHHDSAEVCRRLFSVKAPLGVENVRCQMGDLHNGGRSVHLLSLSDGRSVLYKPRDLRLDEVFRDLVSDLNERAPVHLRVPDVVLGDCYGWVEHIEHSSCASDEAAERFFTRAGAWLCLFHLFAASDMHEENMIAAGEHPVPIDFETLFQPSDLSSVVEVPARRGYELAAERVADSVVSTGLLPAYGRTANNEIVVNGGLIDPARRNVERAWDRVNADQMKPVVNIVEEGTLANLPLVNGRRASLLEFPAALVGGYREYASFLLAEKGSIEHAFAKCEGLRVRKLLRHTRFYAMLLDRVLHPRSFDDGAAWSVDLDFVARLMDWDREQDPWWPMLKQERASLAELNIPHFTVSTDKDELGEHGGVSSRGESKTGLKRARDRLALLSPDFIEWQCALIEVSTSAVQGNRTTTPSLRNFPRPVRCGEPSKLFLERADAIRDHIAESACHTGNSAGWIGLDWLRDSVVCQLAPLGADFYNGSTGIATFLAAHARVTGSAFSAEMALAGLAPVRQDLKGSNAARAARSLGIGGSVGLGSVVYALTTISQLLGDRGLLDDARVAAEHITETLIANDRHLDAMEGAAGAILGLLRLYRATGDEAVLKRATRCGAHILRNRSRTHDDALGWGIPELNGMSHGASGFAYALAALSSHAQTRGELLEAVNSCLLFEDRYYSAAKGNWPDFRQGDPEKTDFWPCQWCHGAVGIGLARLGIIQSLSNGEGANCRQIVEAARVGLGRAIDAATLAWPYPTDTLCCGSLGNIELLSDVASMTGRGDLATMAIERMADIVSEADMRGDYSWDISDKRFNIGLFRGLSGVGYSLLRRVDRTLPNILIWQ